MTSTSLRIGAPLAVALAVAVAPVPAGLPANAWHYFAVFAGVLVGLILEPLPNAAVGLIGVVTAAALAPWTLLPASELARPGFDRAGVAIDWALTGFHNPAVWLAFSAFMFGLGYERTGLGRRIALVVVRALGGRTVRLGYAVVLVETLLAPFTPSNTARSAGTVYPILRNLPPLYGSEPDSPSAARIGTYLMWTAFAASCVTSSLFLTALAPNAVAVDIAVRLAQVRIGWFGWFAGAAAFAVPLLVALPWLAYRLCPPQVLASPEVPRWAAAELARQGPVTRPEKRFLAAMCAALALWIVAGEFVHPTTVALGVVALMIATRIVGWQDVAGHRSAWDMLVRLATLVTLADGLNRTGFLAWAAAGAAHELSAWPPLAAMAGLVALYFVSHYLFATTTAHATAVMPIVLGVGLSIPGIPPLPYAMLLAFSHGLMGVLSPYATGPAPVFHGSGFLPGPLFWRLGAIHGAIFLAALLLLGMPAALWMGR